MNAKPNAAVKAKEIQLVVFRIGNEEFGAPIQSVLEISRMVDITHIPETTKFIEGVINLRGQVITVVDTAKQLGFERTAGFPKTAKIVVVESSGEKKGLIVDEVPEVLRVSEEDIQPIPELIQTKMPNDSIKGVAKLGERLILLVNICEENFLSPGGNRKDENK